MEEKNRDTLRRALGQLPDYSPGEPLWSRLEGKLDQDRAADRDALQRGLTGLPAYSPPPKVWNQLSQALEQDQRRPGPARLRRLVIGLSSAAAVVLLCIFAYGRFLSDPPARVALRYSEETVARFAFEADWEREDDNFARLETQLVNVRNPQVNSLHEELTELTAARQEVVEMLRQYGQDPSLVRQLGEIERARSQVYRRIIEHI